MENKRVYTIFVTLMLLSSILLTINVAAENIGSEYISFSTNRNGNYDIYMIDRDGGDLQALLDGPADEIHARWSPDGKWIAYVSDNLEVQHKTFLYVVDAAGEEHAESIRLTTHLSMNILPAWVPEPFFSVSPSGEKMTTLWGKLKQHE